MKEILENLMEMQVKIPVETIILILLTAFILGLVIYFTYKYTYNGVVYNQRFNISIVMITMITTIVMIVIGTNISVSLGMVGALSIVRFRTAVKDPRDTAFIFWGIVVGLACGTQNYYVAIIGSIFLCIILFTFNKLIRKNNKYVLIVKGINYNNEEVERYLEKIANSFKCKGKYINEEKSEAIYEVKLKDSDTSAIINTIKSLNGITIVNLTESNTETMG